jgi:hypothetical protein
LIGATLIEFSLLKLPLAHPSAAQLFTYSIMAKSFADHEENALHVDSR